MWWRISAFCWGVAAPVMSLWGVAGRWMMVMGRPASSAGLGRTPGSGCWSLERRDRTGGWEARGSGIRRWSRVMTALAAPG